ncbi:right-handed parallel beta-helix repeat-containing protein [Fulvimonas yonginensis]|uniref:Right-handed parallel beta-helix repeat-containing protein n=1 Tax=Fulvimonas yonginensis TaxID=1495200 RepID=A0ABU8J878_9GAMM
MIAAASLALSAVALPAAAASWWNANPYISIGKASVNVKDKGARGNGTHDDTAAIQAAIDSLPDTGGTVYVPAGRYMINAKKALRLHSHQRLKLDPDAELMVIPNDAGRYHVVKVWNVNNVEIVGGRMTGDRSRHQGSGGEWGYGINIQGAKNIFVHNVKLSEFWGDGMWIGATGWGSSLRRSNYVTVNNIVSQHNRRQGLSIGPAQHVYIVNSTFKDTRGTLPEAGVDIEPQDQGPANTVRLENNTMSGNRGNGIELHYNISDITIKSNNLTDNHGFGVLAVSAPHLNVAKNKATRNGLAGVGMSGKTHDAKIHGNTLQYNSTRYISPTRSGGGQTRDIQIGTSTYSISQYNNTLTPK